MTGLGTTGIGTGFGGYDRDRQDDGFGDGGENHDDQPFDTESESRLAFDEDSESLPWLESGDEDEAEQGYDTNRLAGFIIGAVLLLGVLIGGMWWLTHRGPDPDMVADGSTIAAPEEPYKTKPEAPGGRTFAGTGDTSFAVGEGRTREGRIASSETPVPAPAPSVAAGGKADAKAAAPAAAAAGGVAVQVGAFSSRAMAEAGWQKLVTTHSVLSGKSHRVVEGSADIGTVYRLQAVAGDVSAANDICATLKSQGAACQVKR